MSATKQRRRAGWIRWPGRVLLVFVVMAAIAHSVAVVVTGRRVEASLAAIRAQGAPTAVKDLGGPPVPDDQNAAIVFRTIFDKLAVAPGETARPHDRGRPDLAIWAWDPPTGPRAKDDQDTLSAYLDPGRRVEEPGLYRRARAALARYPEVPGLVSEALARPRCQYPVNWEDGAGVLLPHLARLRGLARFLCAKAVLDAREGRMDEAARALAMVFGVGETLRDEPNLIGQLVRQAVLHHGCSALREVMEWGDIPEVEARQLSTRFEGIELQPGFVRAMESERALGIWVCDAVRRSPAAVAQLFSEDGMRSWVGRLMGSYAWRPILHLDQAAYLHLIDRQVEAARSPSLHDARPQFRDVDERISALPRYALVSRLCVPGLGRVRLRMDSSRAELAGARVSLALAAYRQQFGRYPESLTELQRHMESSLPGDPFIGKPLAYRRQGAGYLLYSVGEDLQDDGGHPAIALRTRIGAGVLLADRRTGATTPPPARRGPPAKEEPSDLVWRRSR